MDFKRSAARSPSNGQEKWWKNATGTALFFTDVPAISALEQAPKIETVPVSSSREIDRSLQHFLTLQTFPSPNFHRPPSCGVGQRSVARDKSSPTRYATCLSGLPRRQLETVSVPPVTTSRSVSFPLNSFRNNNGKQTNQTPESVARNVRLSSRVHPAHFNQRQNANEQLRCQGNKLAVVSIVDKHFIHLKMLTFCHEFNFSKK